MPENNWKQTGRCKLSETLMPRPKNKKIQRDKLIYCTRTPGRPSKLWQVGPWCLEIYKNNIKNQLDFIDESWCNRDQNLIVCLKLQVFRNMWERSVIVYMPQYNYRKRRLKTEATCWIFFKSIPKAYHFIQNVQRDLIQAWACPGLSIWREQNHECFSQHGNPDVLLTV